RHDPKLRRAEPHRRSIALHDPIEAVELEQLAIGLLGRYARGWRLRDLNWAAPPHSLAEAATDPPSSRSGLGAEPPRSAGDRSRRCALWRSLMRDSALERIPILIVPHVMFHRTAIDRGSFGRQQQSEMPLGLFFLQDDGFM